jgi:plasmid stabilization system protein ParE
MEIETREVVTSSLFDHVNIPSIFYYGKDTFGLKLADAFIEEIYFRIELLESQYLLHPECRHLETKTKIYRNIILGSYLIIYRVTAKRIEVLRGFHGSRSPKELQTARSVKV